MKFYLKILVVIVVLFAVALPLVMKGPDGSPVMSLTDWLPNVDQVLGMARQATRTGKDLAGDSIEKLAAQTAEVVSGRDRDSQSMASELDSAPTTLSADSGKMYKWQDENGRWHFSSQKPGDAKTVSMEDLPEVENVMEAPVDSKSNGSMMGDVGDILEKVQRMAAERDH